MRTVLALGAVLSLVLGCATRLAPEPSPEAVSDGRYIMGTVLEISLHGVSTESGNELLGRLFGVASKLEAEMSSYAPDSDINRINAHAGGEPQAVAASVREILERSIGYTRLTQGSFDVTVGPLVRLWADAAERNRPPSADALARARSLVGSDKIAIDADGRVALIREGMSVSLGGVAKGYALDQMLPILAQGGVDAALLNFGQSSTWAFGAPPGSPGWRLLVRGPDGGFVGLITLRDQALSVSGSLGQFVKIGGRAYGHILDPRTGQPLTRRRQALVVANDAALAEALSKALLVLDAEEGIALVAGREGCEGLLVEGDGTLHATSGWQAATRFEKLEPPSQPQFDSRRGGEPPIQQTMGLADLSCPICSADFALGGDEKAGEEVFCSYCGAPCRLTADPYAEDCGLEEEI